MYIQNNSVVTMHYCLALVKGQTIDSSFDKQPMSFLIGSGAIIKGLEQSLLGKKVGDTFNTSVKAKDAYGIYNKDLVQVVPKTSFEENEDLKEGMQVQAESETGVSVFTIIKINNDQITLDENHPLAGQELNFDIQIINIRLATEEEQKTGRMNQDLNQNV